MADLNFTDYASLKLALAGELNRGDLVSAIPLWVQLLEADLDTHEAVRYERTARLTLQTSPFNLPSDCRELRSLRYNDGVRFGPVDIRPEEDLPRFRALFGLTGFPRAAAVVANGTQLLLAPVPDQAYLVDATYLTRLDKLSAGATTNWVLADFPDIYFYGTLLHSAPFLKNDDRVQTWSGFYKNGMTRLDSYHTRQKYGANTLVMRPKRAIG